MLLELTTRFTPITTGAGSKRQKSASDAVAAGTAHLQYILRSSAMKELAWSGVPGEDNAARKKALRERMRALSVKGGKLGARVAEKGIVSLPNAWPVEARQEAVERLSRHLAPFGSEAMAVVVTHQDKPGNSHLHFLALDGAESQEAARARRPEAKRVRRAQVIRLGDRGRPQELRQEIGGILNQIAAERGLEGVEWRSFKHRGVSLTPTLHEGPTRRARVERIRRPDPIIQENERRRQERVSDELDSFFYTEGVPMDLGEFDREDVPAPVKIAPAPPDNKRENIRFRGLRERIREWVLTAKKQRPPRSR